MNIEDKVTLIDETLKKWFESHPWEKGLVPAKDFMSEFVKAGIFTKDDPDRPGKSIRELLRKLDANDQLWAIPYVWADRGAHNVNWYFRYVDDAKFEAITKAMINHC